MTFFDDKISVVVIGRNEGDRLKNCLQTLMPQSRQVVYVDSGSTDKSVAFARSMGVSVVELDTSIPFNAGRARNEGFALALNQWPETEYVQFIDGDCELEKGWLDFARNYLAENDSWAIVAGRRKERYPEKSIYNLLCDIEWNTPVGQTRACGGDFMVKTTAFQQVKGFNLAVIAGEEPELCHRLRQNGWEIQRLDYPMTLHDANMMYLGQWWKRCVRSGHAFAQGVSISGWSISDANACQSLRIWGWGVLMPIVALLLLGLRFGAIFLFLFYGLQICRITVKMLKRHYAIAESFYYGLFVIISRWPQVLGQITFIRKKYYNRTFQVIEYK